MNAPMTRARLLGAVALCGLLAACGGETASTEGPAPPEPTREPTPYVPQLEDEPVSPGLDLAALDRVLTAQIRTLMNTDARGIPEVVASLIDLTDPDCPGGEVYTEDEMEWVYAANECTAADGTTYRGELRLGRFAHAEGEGRREGFIIEAGGGARIETADGRFLELSGYMEAGFGEEEGGTFDNLYLGLRVQADPTTAGDDPLLGGQITGNMGRYVHRAADGNLWMSITIAQALDDPAISAVQLDEVVFNTWLCADEPAGTVSVREVDGQWHDLLYDGFERGDEEAGEEPMASESCDRCAVHLYNGAREPDACEGSGWLSALLEEARR